MTALNRPQTQVDPETVPEPDSVPLYVDLDGTLVKSDLLVESLLILFRRAPWRLLQAPLWLAGGKGRLKAEVTSRCTPPVDALPLQEDLVGFLRAAAGRGRPIFLATASDRRVAEKVADRVGCFSGILGSDRTVNLKGRHKLAAIREHAAAPFDYAGNDRSDLAVWSGARKAILVNPGLGVLAAAARSCTVDRVFEDRPPPGRTWFRALRLYQWTKNLLVAVPLWTAHAFTQRQIGAAAAAFLAFGLVASSLYLLNDLLDLEADRLHPRKRERPFAAGNIGLKAGFAAMLACLSAGLLVAALLPRPFLAAACAYAALSLAYSLYFKTVVLLDVILLGALYTLRIVAGAAAIGVDVSSWLLAFSMFAFNSIALVKRSSELRALGREADPTAARRGYRPGDDLALTVMGVASGYLSVLVLALFVNSPGTPDHYRHPERLWLLCPLMLYWVSRLWIKTSRGEMHDDPLFYSLQDLVSWVVLCAMVLATLWAI